MTTNIAKLKKKAELGRAASRTSDLVSRLPKKFIYFGLAGDPTGILARYRELEERLNTLKAIRPDYMTENLSTLDDINECINCAKKGMPLIGEDGYKPPNL